MFSSSNTKAYGVLYGNENIVNEETWSGHVLKKIAGILKTHVLQVDLQPIPGADRGKNFLRGFIV